MKSSEVAAQRPSESASLATRWSRRVIHSLLRRIRHGSLTIEEAGQVHEFGESRKHASIKASIHVLDAAAYGVVLRNGSVGAGEAYMHALWDTPDLLEVVRLFVANMQVLHGMKPSPARNLWLKLTHWLRRNHKEGAKTNIAAHYDLSNDFFKLFLDETLAYSSGIFVHADSTLEQASIAKFKRICEKLELGPGDHLLEIGTGWGGLAIYATKHYGCRVTTTTLSRQQLQYAQAWVAREGLADRITLLDKDYRDLEGTFDKLVSVEMIEAVGAQFYGEYFAKCSQLLRPEGLMLIQAITISDQRYDYSLRNMDFIKRYVFPGGQLPCNAEIARNVAQHTDLQLIDLRDISLDYARTLNAWRARFQKQLPAVRQLGFDEAFIRMWRYYLCFCEGGFRERVIHTAQFLMAKPHWRPVPGALREPAPSA